MAIKNYRKIVDKKTNDGTSFTITRTEAIAGAATADFLILPGATRKVHLTSLIVSSDDTATVEFVENANVTGAGTDVTALGKNRQTSITPLTKGQHTPTVGVGGTSLYMRALQTSGELDVCEDGKTILENSVEYNVQIINTGAGGNVSINATFYEEN